MPVSIDWGTRVITIPSDYLTHVSGPMGIGGLYELDVNSFRLDLKDLEDSPEGMPFPVTHSHNGEVVLAGVTYSRSVEIINGYTVKFDDTVFDQYTVRCVGANHNLADVKVLNTISLIIGNSAGLVTISGGSADPAAIAAAVWARSTTSPTAGSYGAWVQKLLTVAKFIGLK